MCAAVRVRVCYREEVRRREIVKCAAVKVKICYREG